MPNLKTANVRSSQDTFHVFGTLSGTSVGDSWQTREALSDSWVHRPKAASLHVGSEGVYSILINRRFRGEDNGFTITYSGTTGKGGGYNDYLIKNCRTKLPVRVIRGAKKNNYFAPSSGFRYDGLYAVEKYCKEKEHVKFFLRRLTEQSVAPWIKPMPNRPSPLTLKTLQSDLKRYIAYIRCQSRTVPDGTTVEQEQEQEQVVAEEDSSRITSQSEEGTNNPPEEASTRDENNPPPTTIGNDAPVTNSPEEAGTPPASLETIQQLQTNVSSSPSDEIPGAQTSSSSSAVENNESAASEPSPLVQGFPLPQKFDAIKEEIKSAGSVVIETLPQEDYYAVYNERVIYEEEEAHVTEVCSDDDVWVDEEIEIDSKVIEDVSQTHIVTALSLPQNHELPLQKFQQRLEIVSDIDVEDGPKFGHTIGSSLSVETEVLPEISTESMQETLLGQEIIKTDQEDHDGGSEELPQIQVSTEQEMENSGSGDCLYIYPRTKWKNVDEAEQEILNGNFHWYQGNRPIQDPFSITNDLVQEFGQETPVTQTNISNEVDGTEGNVAELENQSHVPYLCQQLSLFSGQKPDSTSNMSLDHKSNQCHPEDPLCQYNDLTLGELLAFTFNEPPNGCVCRYAKRLPHMNYFIQQMLQARKGFLSENDVKQILPSQQDESEEVIGTISHVQTVDSKTWSNVTQTDEDTSLPYKILEENNGDGDEIPINTAQEINSQDDVELVDGIVPQPISLNDPKMTSLNRIESLWRGLAEIRDEALKRIYSTPQPKLSDNPDMFKDGEGSIEEVDEKVSKLPSFFNERKEMILHHCRKRKIGNLRVDNESGQSSIIQEVSQPKRRMLQLRSVRNQT